jgi:hypothetical protein
MSGRMEYISELVSLDRRKIAMCESGSLSKVIGRIVHHRGWEHVPQTSIPSGSLSDFLGTRRPQLGSWIRSMDVSVVSRIEISALG